MMRFATKIVAHCKESWHKSVKRNIVTVQGKRVGRDNMERKRRNLDDTYKLATKKTSEERIA